MITTTYFYPIIFMQMLKAFFPGATVFLNTWRKVQVASFDRSGSCSLVWPRPVQYVLGQVNLLVFFHLPIFANCHTGSLFLDIPDSFSCKPHCNFSNLHPSRIGPTRWWDSYWASLSCFATPPCGCTLCIGQRKRSNATTTWRSQAPSLLQA